MKKEIVETNQTPIAATDKIAHTPGPWSAFELPEMHEASARIISINPANGNEVVAHAVPIGHREERNANARLIAAAPELLEACKELIRVCQWDAKTYGHSTNHTVIDQARAAIAKAEVK